MDPISASSQSLVAPFKKPVRKKRKAEAMAEQPTARLSWGNMPFELIEHIFSFLRIPEKHLVARSNRHWYRCMGEADFFLKVLYPYPISRDDLPAEPSLYRQVLTRMDMRSEPDPYVCLRYAKALWEEIGVAGTTPVARSFSRITPVPSEEGMDDDDLVDSAGGSLVVYARIDELIQLARCVFLRNKELSLEREARLLQLKIRCITPTGLATLRDIQEELVKHNRKVPRTDSPQPSAEWCETAYMYCLPLITGMKIPEVPHRSPQAQAMIFAVNKIESSSNGSAYHGRAKLLSALLALKNFCPPGAIEDLRIGRSLTQVRDDPSVPHDLKMTAALALSQMMYHNRIPRDGLKHHLLDVYKNSKYQRERCQALYMYSQVNVYGFPAKDLDQVKAIAFCREAIREPGLHFNAVEARQMKIAMGFMRLWLPPAVMDGFSQQQAFDLIEQEKVMLDVEQRVGINFQLALLACTGIAQGGQPVSTISQYLQATYATTSTDIEPLIKELAWVLDYSLKITQLEDSENLERAQEIFDKFKTAGSNPCITPWFKELILFIQAELRFRNYISDELLPYETAIEYLQHSVSQFGRRTLPYHAQEAYIYRLAQIRVSKGLVIVPDDTLMRAIPSLSQPRYTPERQRLLEIIQSQQKTATS